MTNSTCRLLQSEKKMRVSKKYLAPSIYSYPYWRLKSNIRFYKGVFCLFGHPHMINLYFGSIFVYIPLSVPWLRTTRIIIFRRCRDKRFMFLSFLCNKDSDEFFLIPNVFSVFYIESSKCIILYKWKRLCISR